jgi:hypothetical protein
MASEGKHFLGKGREKSANENENAKLQFSPHLSKVAR